MSPSGVAGGACAEEGPLLVGAAAAGAQGVLALLERARRRRQGHGLHREPSDK